MRVSVTIPLPLNQFENHDMKGQTVVLVWLDLHALAHLQIVSSTETSCVHFKTDKNSLRLRNSNVVFKMYCVQSHHSNLISRCVYLQVYAVGGYDGQSRLSSVECYDSFSNRWTEVAPMKEAVSSPAVASCVNKLFVIGGGPDDNTCSDKVCRRV